MAVPDIYSRRMIDVLTPELESTIRMHYTLQAFEVAGYTRGWLRWAAGEPACRHGARLGVQDR
jgi:hypothetical protein